MPEVLALALAAHLDELKEADYAPATVRKRDEAVMHFCRQRRLPPHFPVADVTRAQVEAFLAEGRQRWAGRTERKYYQALNELFASCVRRGILATSPMEGMEPPSYADLPQAYRVYTDEEIEAIFAACDEGGVRWMRHRNRAIIWLMLSAGCRRREILALQVNDVDLPARSLTLSRRTVALDPRAAAAIERYLAARKSDLSRLFLSRGRKPMMGKAFTGVLWALSRVVGQSVNGARLRATWRAKSGLYRRPHHNPNALINRRWPDGLMVQARDVFLLAIDAQGLSPRTARAYSDTLAWFFAYFLPRRPQATPSDVSPGDIEAFLVFLKGRGLAPASRHAHFRGLRRWFGFLTDRGMTPANPVLKVRAPRLPAVTIEPYSHADVEAMVAAARATDRASRNATIVTILYGTGLRAGELRNLATADVRPGQLLIRQGKGHKDRYVPLDRHVEGTLRRYAEGRNGPGVLFPLSHSGLYHLIRRLGEAAGIKRPFVHRFRDSFAVRWLENGGPIDDLQVVLGHAEIETTLRYVRWNREQRAVAAGWRYSPWAAGNGHSDDRREGLTLLEELDAIRRRWASRS